MLTALLALSAALAPLPGWSADAETLARAHAPVFIQEAQHRGKNRTQDVPVAFDFDGDWDMSNNWRNQPAATAGATPVVHWSVVATPRRAYVSYFLFYPRDWSRICLPLVCHENDLEQLTLGIDNDGTPTGRPLLLDVKYHRDERQYPIPGGALPHTRTPAKWTATADGRSLLRIEWGGHGITSCDLDGDGRLDRRCVKAPSRHTFVMHPEGATPVTLAGADAPRAYELRSMRETLWARRHDRTLWARDWFAYDGARLGRIGRAVGMAFAGSGPGGGARAPWGIRAKGELRNGDRFLDPEHALAAKWRLPPASESEREYVTHPYLADLAAECQGAACDSDDPTTVTATVSASATP